MFSNHLKLQLNLPEFYLDIVKSWKGKVEVKLNRPSTLEKYTKKLCGVIKHENKKNNHY